MVNYFHLFYDVSNIIDSKLMLMNFLKLIVQSCAKCQYAHLLCLKKFGKKFRFSLTCDYGMMPLTQIFEN